MPSISNPEVGCIVRCFHTVLLVYKERSWFSERKKLANVYWCDAKLLRNKKIRLLREINLTAFDLINYTIFKKTRSDKNTMFKFKNSITVNDISPLTSLKILHFVSNASCQLLKPLRSPLWYISLGPLSWVSWYPELI